MKFCLLMVWSVSTVRTGAGWQVSVDRPGNTALLYGLFQNLAQAQAGTRLRSLLDSDQATAVLSGLTLLTTDQTADDVAWMVPDPAIQVPVRLNGHQQACVSSPDTKQAQTDQSRPVVPVRPVPDGLTDCSDVSQNSRSLLRKGKNK